MASIRQDVFNEWNKSDVTLRLVIINTLVFLGINAVYLLVPNAEENAGRYALYLASSASLRFLLYHPWTIITHMFAHVEFSHWLWNMVALYFSSVIFIYFLGKKKLVTLYFGGGLAGFSCFVLLAQFIPTLGRDNAVLGASAAIMAIFLAAAATAPDFEVSIWGIIRVKLKYLAAVYVILDFVSLRGGWNSGGHIAHLGGALFGFLYARQLKEGKNLLAWLETQVGRLFFGERRRRVHAVKTRSAATKSDELFNLEKKERQQRIDSILDKISKAGYESLTKEEKDFLFRFSQK